MIAMISPGNSDVEHTLNTLRYADRVKELGTEGNGVDNTEGMDYKKEQEELDFLEEEEAQFRRHYNDGNGLTDSQEEDHEEDYEDDEESQAMNDLQKTLAELQDMEEQVLENHGDLIKESHRYGIKY